MAIRVSNVTGQILYTPSDILLTVSQNLNLQQSTIKEKIRVSNTTIQILQKQQKPKKQILLGSNIAGYGF